MEHPDTRVVVIVVGGREDPATNEDAETLIEMIEKRTMLKAHPIHEKSAVNRILYHLVGLPGF